MPRERPKKKKKKQKQQKNKKKKKKAKSKKQNKTKNLITQKIKNKKQKTQFKSEKTFPLWGTAVTNLTSNHEDTGSIPGLAQQAMYLALPWAVLQEC